VTEGAAETACDLDALGAFRKTLLHFSRVLSYCQLPIANCQLPIAAERSEA
jgi:hypothetical protein